MPLRTRDREMFILIIERQILQRIASLMATDRDVTTLSQTCKEINGRVMAPDSSIWRTRFKEKYDLPGDRTSSELKPEYQSRAIVLPRKLDFKQAENPQQKIWLEVIQTMVKESITLPVEMDISKTYGKIREVMTEVEFLSHPRRDTPSDTFCAVQLVRLLVPKHGERMNLLIILCPFSA